MAEFLGKYELRQVLGKGAMGTVYEGFDPIIARRVAIKTVRLPEPDDVEAQDELARFKREAQAAGRLTHPNIVGVFDYGETPELAYIVMEFVDGTTLKHVMDKKERFELPEIVRIMELLLAGLQFSHDRGVVHRDIKPANIMLTSAGEVKIADFGIARIESSSMTQAGTMLGTPSYMSPEQFMGQTVDSRTDIYSSGVLLYQLLTGEKPFEGGLTAIMHKVLNTEPPPPSALSVTVPHAFDAVVQKAMAKRPDERFASAHDFARALRDAVDKKPAPAENFGLGDFGDSDATMVAASRPAAPKPAPAPPSQPPAPAAPAKKGPPMALIGGGILVLLLILGAAAYFALGGPPKPANVAATTPPAPAPQPMPPAEPAAPPPPAPPTAAQIDAALRRALGALPCTLLNASTAGNAVTVTGIAGVATPPSALTAAIASLPAGITASLDVAPADGPYCGALDAIRPYHALFADPASAITLGLAGGTTTLHDGAMITVQQTTPPADTNFVIDYFQSDGTVYHLPLKPQPGSNTLSQDVGNVSAPYGTDLIVSIASSAPIFSAPRANSLEKDSDYLPALTQALQTASATGANITVAALPVTTLPK